MSKTYRAQVKGQQSRPAKEAIVHGWHIAPNNEKDDASVVQLVSPLGHLGAVVGQGMVSGAHAQAAESAQEETGEDEDVRPRGGLISRGNDVVEEEAAKGEGDGAQEMSPDIDKLIVQVKDGPEGFKIAVGGAAVARVDEVVVAAPVGEFIPQHQQGVLDPVFNILGRLQQRVGSG